MRGLREAGCEVHIVSGCHSGDVNAKEMDQKRSELAQLGFQQGVDFDRAVATSGPKKKIPQGKVDYMRKVGASGLIDNDKKNIKAATKAGFLGLRHVDPK